MDMKACLVLYFVTAVHCADVYIQCNEECTATENKISQQPFCCFEFLSESATMERGVSPQKPDTFTIDLYAHRQAEGKSIIALNITWSIYMRDVSATGYLMNSVMSMSEDWRRVLFRVSNINVTEDQDPHGRVHFNFQKYGLVRDTELQPGNYYSFTISSLPQPGSDERIVDDRAWGIVKIPACRCKPLAQLTINCEEKCLPKPTIKAPNKDITLNVIMTSVAVPTTIPLEEPPYRLLAVGLTGLVALLAFVVVIICFMKIRPSQVKDLKQAKVFVVYSSLDCTIKSLHLKAASCLCCYLTDLTMKVNFTPWSGTKMGELPLRDIKDILKKEVAEADHVVFIVTPNVGVEKCEEGSRENQPLLNPVYDPFNIALHLMETSQGPKDKFSAVCFNENPMENLKNFPQLHCFQLPKDLPGLLHKITLAKQPQNVDAFKKELIEITQNI